MDEAQIIRCEIPCDDYERKIAVLIAQLLEFDEEMQKLENNGSGCDQSEPKAVAA
jgi:hypothetical protein